MKVALVAYGHADNVLCLSRALARYACVTVFFVTSGDNFTASVFDWDISTLPFGLTDDHAAVKRFVGDKIIRYLGSDVKICIVRTPSRKILKDIRRRNYIYIREAIQFINSHQYDIIHFNGSSGFQIYFQELLGNVAKVLTIHDYLPHTGEATCRRKWVNILLNKLYTRFDYEFIQHYRYLSDKFSKFYGVKDGRTHTVYCGPLEIYRIFRQSGIAEEPHTLLFFGRISQYKGLEYLISAFRQVRRMIPDTKLIIAGKGKLNMRLSEDDNYEVYNRYVTNEELASLLQRAAIVVTPYTDATHSAVIMTAFAFHKPVVSSAVGGIPEVIADDVTGRLVPPRDSAAFASAILDLLQNSNKRREMARNIVGRFESGMFSWDCIAKRTLQVYNKALLRK